MSKTIVLIGLSGCGKTTYAKELSQKLKWPFYDIDEVIAFREQMSVSDIFKTKGETYFRALEWQVFTELIQLKNIIIATGGGLIPCAFNRNESKPSGVFFLYLNPPLETILMRLQKPNELAQRPLLVDDEDLFTRLKKLHQERSKAYLSWADAIISNW